MAIVRGKKTKNPPVLSHEFVIQNHGDIVSCAAMVFIFGLMFQVTSPVFYLFVALQHNTSTDNVTFYTAGWKDFFTLFYYSLIAIVTHAVIQEYVLDKIGKKLHLSKLKSSKFNEAGQLVVFYILSVVWTIYAMSKEDLPMKISSLWKDYPQTEMPFSTKIFYIGQLAYWLHWFPEMYFMKMKAAEMKQYAKLSVLYLAYIGAAYVLNLHRFGLVVIFLHYMSEASVYAWLMYSFLEKKDKKTKVSRFIGSDVVFALCRLLTIAVSFLTLALGLSDVGGFEDRKSVLLAIRWGGLTAAIGLQAYFMYFFIKERVKQYRQAVAAAHDYSNKKNDSDSVGGLRKHAYKNKQESKMKTYELTEADQNIRRTNRNK